MKTEVLIIGGGIGGLSLAVLLGQAGLGIALVEPHPMVFDKNAGQKGRTAALMGSSINVLKALGVWDMLVGQTAPLHAMRIIDDSNPNLEPVQVDFPANDIGQDFFGHNVPNMMLHEILAQKIKSIPSISLYCPARLESFSVQGQKIEAALDIGKTITASLIVGADGKKSRTRELAKIGCRQHDYGQSAITCLISHSKPHQNISTEHHRPGGPFTTVPMPDDENGQPMSSIVWVEKTEDSDNFMKLDKASFEKALQIRTRDALGEVRLASNPESWPLHAIIADKVTAPRTALIAEAAHAMSPIGAQGLNLSLRDVASLSETIIDALRLGEDIGSDAVLSRYAKRRSLDINTRFHGVDKYNKIVSNNLGFLRGLRRAGFKTMDTIPVFKNLAMQYGLFSSPDEGRIIKGEAL